jgi:hypothetical protein
VVLEDGDQRMDELDNFEREGFAIVPAVLDPEEVEALTCALAEIGRGSVLRRGDEVYASRNLLGEVQAVREVAMLSKLRTRVERVIGRSAFAVRGLLFDKTPTANWAVPWHQDLTIAVKSRVHAEGFGPWTIKAGVTHVRPPIEVLRRMVTVRLQLDDCAPESGPLRVIPGSHRDGLLGAGATRQWLERVSANTCLVPRGGALLMRPLILHASSPSDSPGHRRVVHLEYAAEPLPARVQWYERHGFFSEKDAR